MMTFAVFVVIRKLKVRASVCLSRLASLTFGIYLCHFIFVQVGYDLMGTLDALPVLLRIFCIALFCLRDKARVGLDHVPVSPDTPFRPVEAFFENSYPGDTVPGQPVLVRYRAIREPNPSVSG